MCVRHHRDNDIDDGAAFDAARIPIIKPEPRDPSPLAAKPEPHDSTPVAASKSEPNAESEEKPASTWTSVGQLTLFREQAHKIAEDFLKQKKIKLHAGRKRRTMHDPEVRAGLS